MHLRSARQRLPRLQRCFICQPMRIAERDDPGIIHRQKIQQCPQKFRIACTGAQIALRTARCPKKNRQKLVIPDKPRQRLKRDRFGDFLRHGHDEKTFRDPGKGLLTELPKDCDAQVKHGCEGIPVQGTVLIADGVSTGRILLNAKLGSWSQDIVMAASGQQMLDHLAQQGASLIILSDDLPDLGAVDLCTRLKQDDRWARIPVITIARAHDTTQRLALLGAGADEVFAHPVPDILLQARVRSLIRARTGLDELQMREGTARALGFAEAQSGFRPRSRVMILTPQPDNAEDWRQSTASAAGKVRLEAGAFRAGTMQIADGPVPDVFVLGLDGQDASQGLRLLADLRASPRTRHANIMAVLDADAGDKLAADALDLGADDLMLNGFDAQELALRLSSQIALKQTRDLLRQSVRDGLRDAVRDPMTGLFNRRYAMPYLSRVIERNAASGRGFAVMIADLDHFKGINDRFGHAVGDAVLTQAAARLRNDLRAEDLIARMGGEEFLIVLPDSSKADAMIAAERLRNHIDSRPFRVAGVERPIRMTVSIGVAVCCFECLSRKPAADSAAALLKMADDALYGSKDAGRNLVTMVDAA